MKQSHVPCALLLSIIHIVSESRHSYKMGRITSLLDMDFLEAQVHGKYEALWKGGQMCPPSFPRLQLGPCCVFTIADTLVNFVTKFHCLQTCQLPEETAGSLL